jgi:hypothetical protein
MNEIEETPPVAAKPVWRERWFFWLVAVLVLMAVGAIGAARSQTGSSDSGAGWRDATVAALNEAAGATSQITADSNAGDQLATETDCTDALARVPGWESTFSAVPIEAVRVPLDNALGDLRDAFAACAGGDFNSASVDFGASTIYADQADAAINK